MIVRAKNDQTETFLRLECFGRHVPEDLWEIHPDVLARLQHEHVLHIKHQMYNLPPVVSVINNPKDDT